MQIDASDPGEADLTCRRVHRGTALQPSAEKLLSFTKAQHVQKTGMEGNRMNRKRMTKRLIRAMALILCMALCLMYIPGMQVAVHAAEYTINGKLIPSPQAPADGSNPYCKENKNCHPIVGSGKHYCCYQYAYGVYKYIWGKVPNRENPADNQLRNVSAGERLLTEKNLQRFLSQAAPGANLRIDKDSVPEGYDNDGHSLIFLRLNDSGDGAFFLEGNYDGKGHSRINNWKFSDLIKTYGSKYTYIKYILWPNATAYLEGPEGFQYETFAYERGQVRASQAFDILKYPHNDAVLASDNAHVGRYEIFIVKRIVKNTHGNLWYELEYTPASGNKVNGFVYSGFTTDANNNPVRGSEGSLGNNYITYGIWVDKSDCRLEGAVNPTGNIVRNAAFIQNGFSIDGTVKSESSLSRIEAHIYGENIHLSSQQVFNNRVTKSYNIGNSKVNWNLKFNDLPTGTYSYVVKAYIYSACMQKELCVEVAASDFKVVPEGHSSHSFTAASVISPTCTQQGYTLYRCASCAVTEKRSYTEALGHSYQVSGETGGVRTYQCTRCQHQYTENVSTGSQGQTSGVQAQGASYIKRSDGIWLYPVESTYYRDYLVDFAGCTGVGRTCILCGKRHAQYDDPAGVTFHNNDYFGHLGLDIGVGSVKAMAPADGKVAAKGYYGDRGNTLVLEHKIVGTNYSYYSVFQHLASFKVEVGDSVTVGQTVAITGNTGGASTGAHLHFEILRGPSGKSGYDFLWDIELFGWLKSASDEIGCLVVNPAKNSPAGLTALTSATEHAGSVMYTFNKAEVTIGGQDASYNEGPADYRYKTYAYESTEYKTLYDFALKAVPYSNGADVQDGWIPQDSTVKVKRLVLGKADTKLWFEIDYRDSEGNLKTGFAYSGYRTTASGGIEAYAAGDSPIDYTAGMDKANVRIDNPIKPTGNLQKNAAFAQNGFNIGGTVKSESSLVKVEAHIYGENTHLSSQATFTDKLTRSYSIGDNSPVNLNLKFNELQPGSYTYVVKAYYASACMQKTECAELAASSFNIVPEGHTSHSFTAASVTPPTCTLQGYTVYRCTVCNATEKRDYTEALGHSYHTQSVPGDCETDGSCTYLCIRCEDSFTEITPAPGHTLELIESCEKDCISPGKKTYCCATCHVLTEEVDPPEEWSQWSTDCPEKVYGDMIENRDQFRYAPRETVILPKSQTPPEGSTLIGDASVWGSYGSWSAWQTGKVTASNSTQVETRTTYSYYYFLCSKCGAHMHGYGSCYTWAGGCGATTTEAGWRLHWSTTPVSKVSFTDWYGTGKYSAVLDGQRVFRYDNSSSRTEYRYRTRALQEQNEYLLAPVWSEWSFDMPPTGDYRTETRTVYRYGIYEPGPHHWDEGLVTTPSTAEREGECTFTCQKCGETKVEPLPVLAAEPVLALYAKNAAVTPPDEGWKAGTNSFTVDSDIACYVAVSYDGGSSYTHLTGVQAEEGYCYTVEHVDAETLIAVGFVGDINSDGKISNADITRLAAIYAGKATASNALADMLCDVNHDGKLTNSDLVRLKAAFAGKRMLDW